jgi:hypothetical protein
MVLARRLLSAARGGGSFAPPLEDTVFHGAKAYHNTTVNWNDQDSKALPLNSEEFDTDGYHSTVTNNELMTIPAGLAGYYLCHASAYIAGDPAQDAPLYILKNYTSGGIGPFTVRGGQMTPYTAQPSAVGGVATISCVVYLAEGDDVRAWLYVDNDGGGGTYAVGGTTNLGTQMSLAIARLGT